MLPRPKALARVAEMIVELAWTSADDSHWDRDMTSKIIRERLVDSPELASLFEALSDEDRTGVFELVLREMAARDAPKA